MVFSIQKTLAVVFTRSQPFEFGLAGPVSLARKIPPTYSELLLMLKYPWVGVARKCWTFPQDQVVRTSFPTSLFSAFKQVMSLSLCFLNWTQGSPYSLLRNQHENQVKQLR